MEDTILKNSTLLGMFIPEICIESEDINIMKLYFDFKERRSEDGVKYSSLESRFLGDVFKSALDSDSISSYDGEI